LGFLSLIYFASCENWAVLIAGSRHYRNYRHQSDIFQTYQILLKRGFKPENIILFAYDDIATDPDNPLKGQIFNIKKNVNVYPGSDKIDYKGKDVNSQQFVSVLLGEPLREGDKVLRSTKDDNVFVFYNDHGTRGFLCMPRGNGPFLSAQEFKETILTMKKKKMFKKLFINIEACYSGSVTSLLEGIPDVVTLCAASPYQSSYSKGYDYRINTFRTNEFTSNFLSRILLNPNDSVNGVIEYTKDHVKGSQVQSTCDENLINSPISDFLGDDEPQYMLFENKAEEEEDSSNEELVNSMDTQIAFLKTRIKVANTSQELYRSKMALYKELKRRGHVKTVMQKIMAPFSQENIGEMADEYPTSNIEWTCYEKAVHRFQSKCGDLDEYEYKKIPAFAKICDNFEEKDILRQIDRICPTKQW